MDGVKQGPEVVRQWPTTSHIAEVGPDLRFVGLTFPYVLDVANDDRVAKGADGKLDHAEFNQMIDVFSQRLNRNYRYVENTPMAA